MDSVRMELHCRTPAAVTENCLVGETVTHGVRSVTMVVSESQGDAGGRPVSQHRCTWYQSVNIIIRMLPLSSSLEGLACGWMFLRWASSTGLQDGLQRSRPVWFWSPRCEMKRSILLITPARPRSGEDSEWTSLDHVSVSGPMWVGTKKLTGQACITVHFYSSGNGVSCTKPHGQRMKEWFPEEGVR